MGNKANIRDPKFSLYISVKTASAQYGPSESEIWEALRDGRLPAYRPAGIRRTFVSRYDMTAFMRGYSALPRKRKGSGVSRAS